MSTLSHVPAALRTMFERAKVYTVPDRLTVILSEGEVDLCFREEQGEAIVVRLTEEQFRDFRRKVGGRRWRDSIKPNLVLSREERDALWGGPRESGGSGSHAAE